MAGWAVGDHILQVNGVIVLNPQQLAQELRKAQSAHRAVRRPIQLEIWRPGGNPPEELRTPSTSQLGPTTTANRPCEIGTYHISKLGWLKALVSAPAIQALHDARTCHTSELGWPKAGVTCTTSLHGSKLAIGWQTFKATCITLLTQSRLSVDIAVRSQEMAGSGRNYLYFVSGIWSEQGNRMLSSQRVQPSGRA